MLLFLQGWTYFITDKMISQDNHNTQEIDDAMPTLHEQLECRRVFARRNQPCPDVDQAWEKFAAQLHEVEEEGEDRKGPSLFRWLIAACVTVAVVLSVAFLYNSTHSHDVALQVCEATHEQKCITVSDDEGNDKVLLKGQDVVFNKPQVKSRAIKTVTVKTSRGKDCHVVLPDGSEVWLNAESSLEFPETFVGKTREIQLHGEAYFDVKHDERHPFIVNSQFFSTVVYGTEFDMNVREESTANVILVRGSVAMRDAQEPTKMKMLVPGQQAMLAADGFVVQDVNPYPWVQWREGFFYFDNEPLADIMRQLGQWYDTNVVFTDSNLMQVRLHFVADRSNSLQEIMESINKMQIIRLTWKDNTVVVSKNE